MNRRIKELAELASYHANTYDATGNPIWFRVYNKKFAELIVRECAQFVEAKLDFCGDEIIIAESILEHFGVGDE